MVAAVVPIQLSYIQQFSILIKPVREHLDLISQAITAIANSLFLAGKLFVEMPQAITRSAFVAINAVGFLFLDWQVSFTIKTYKDCAFAYSVENWKKFSLTLISTINAVSDILLMIGGLAASLLSWAHRPALSMALYTVLRPWGIAFLFIAVALDVGNFYSNKALIQQLDGLSGARAQNVLKVLCNRSSVTVSPDEATLASNIRASMDKYTLEKLLEKGEASTLSPSRALTLLEQIKANVGTQLSSDENNLGLRALGYAGLFVCKAYPDTLIHAITLFVISLLYTASRADKKLNEMQQRHHIEKA